jgi:hypothetical protein
MAPIRSAPSSTSCIDLEIRDAEFLLVVGHEAAAGAPSCAWGDVDVLAEPRGAGIRPSEEVSKAMTISVENGRNGRQPAMHTPPVVSPQAWEAARERLLVKEKAPDPRP